MKKQIRKLLDKTIKDEKNGFEKNVRYLNRYGISARRWKEVCDAIIKSTAFISLCKVAKKKWKKTGKMIPPLNIVLHAVFLGVGIGLHLKGKPIKQKKIKPDPNCKGVLNKDTVLCG